MEERLMSNHRGREETFILSFSFRKPVRVYFLNPERARLKLFMVRARPDDTFNLLMRGAPHRSCFWVFLKGRRSAEVSGFIKEKTKRIRVIIFQNLRKMHWIGAHADDRWCCFWMEVGMVFEGNNKFLGPYTVTVQTKRRRRKFELKLIFCYSCTVKWKREPAALY